MLFVLCSSDLPILNTVVQRSNDVKRSDQSNSAVVAENLKLLCATFFLFCVNTREQPFKATKNAKVGREALYGVRILRCAWYYTHRLSSKGTKYQQ